MNRNDTYVPKHRAPRPEPALKRGIKKSVLYSGVAVAATGAAVSAGVALDGGSAVATSSALAAVNDGLKPLHADTDTDRSSSASRSELRTADPAKKVELSQASGGQVTRTEEVATGDPRSIARALLPAYGFSDSQFGCLDNLWTRESGWRTTAANPSGAYGIPQALPGSKMATAGADWRYNPETQIRWGLDYIRSRYGTPCGAWAHSLATGWY